MYFEVISSSYISFNQDLYEGWFFKFTIAIKWKPQPIIFATKKTKINNLIISNIAYPTSLGYINSYNLSKIFFACF